MLQVYCRGMLRPEDHTLRDRAAPGLQIDVADAELQAYLQRYPFASGPDEAKNVRGRAAAEAIRLRKAGAPFAVTLLEPVATLLADEEERRLQLLFERVGVTVAEQRTYRVDFGWVKRAHQSNLFVRKTFFLELYVLSAHSGKGGAI